MFGICLSYNCNISSGIVTISTSISSPWSPAFWMATRPRQSLTSTARTGIRVSRRVVQTQLRRMEGVAAMSMRLTRGCGSLGVASLAWVAWQSRRLHIGRILPAKRHGRTSVGRRLVSVAMVMVPDWKWSVSASVICVRMYLFIAGTYWYVLV